MKRFNFKITPTEHIFHTILSTKVDEQLSAKLLDMIDASRGQEFDIVKAESVIK